MIAIRMMSATFQSRKNVLMSSHIKNAIPIQELPDTELWVLYGKSGSGKTHLLATFPKPILYLQFGDDGSGTIKDNKGIDALRITSMAMLKEVLQEARLDKKYKTVAVDTFSLFTQEWQDVNAVKKNKRMTQQMWGDIKTETEELIKSAHTLAQFKVVVLTCHEASDSFEGYEEEILPDVRPSVTRGARTYLESMANYGIHTTVVEVTKEHPTTGEIKTFNKHSCHLASSPYYWVKTQKPSGTKLPKLVINPTYKTIKEYVEGDKE